MEVDSSSSDEEEAPKKESESEVQNENSSDDDDDEEESSSENEKPVKTLSQAQKLKKEAKLEADLKKEQEEMGKMLMS